MTSSPARAAATSMAVVGAVAALATVALVYLTRGQADPRLTRSHLEDGLLAVTFLAFTLTGTLIARHRTAHRVGWTFVAGGLLLQAWVLTTKYALYALREAPGALPGGELAAWVATWIVLPALGVSLPVLFLLVPDGRLPSRRWRPVAWAMGVGLVLATLSWALVPTGDGVFPEAANPIAVGPLDDLHLDGIGWLVLVGSIMVSTVAVRVRLRRSSGAARRQIEWFAYAAVVVVVAWISLSVASEDVPGFQTIADIAFPLALGAVPAAAAIAIFRHNLYDIDLIISRSIVVVALAGLITGTYVVVVAGVGQLIGSTGERGASLSIVATVMVALAFEPARRRMRALADRLVYGERATPYEVLAGFSRAVSGASAVADALPGLARTLAEGTGSASAGLWVLVDRRHRILSSWPPTEPGEGLAPYDERELRESLPAGSELAVVRYAGDRLGALTLTPRAGETVGPAGHRLLTDLAAQAGLLLRNVRLIEELKSSRQRIVFAQDRERRRLERDIHDGVQQRLVSLSLALTMARSKAGRTGDTDTAAAVDAALDETRRTLAELRDLARGIHPAVLTEGGLGPALESLAERASVPTRVGGVPTDRLPGPVEAAIYFTVSEALTNVAKHAHARQAAVVIERTPGRISVEISDDGHGGARRTDGSGLTGLVDRVSALDGAVQLDSPPGGGTRIRAELPCAWS
jgi:signal transduction histidine kinase